MPGCACRFKYAQSTFSTVWANRRSSCTVSGSSLDMLVRIVIRPYCVDGSVRGYCSFSDAKSAAVWSSCVFSHGDCPRTVLVSRVAVFAVLTQGVLPPDRPPDHPKPLAIVSVYLGPNLLLRKRCALVHALVLMELVPHRGHFLAWRLCQLYPTRQSPPTFIRRQYAQQVEPYLLRPLVHMDSLQNAHVRRELADARHAAHSSAFWPCQCAWGKRR